MNRIFEHKTVQFSGLPFCIQEVAKIMNKNRENLDKTIKFRQSCQKSISPTRKFVK